MIGCAFLPPGSGEEEPGGGEPCLHLHAVGALRQPAELRGQGGESAFTPSAPLGDNWTPCSELRVGARSHVCISMQGEGFWWSGDRAFGG